MAFALVSDNRSAERLGALESDLEPIDGDCGPARRRLGSAIVGRLRVGFAVASTGIFTLYRLIV